MKLTPKQKAFADEYLICGNATEAAKKAGYKEKAAYAMGAENLKKPQISAYIAERQKQIEDSRIADIKEVMEFYSAVLRGEIKDQFDMDAALSDRLAAGRVPVFISVQFAKCRNFFRPVYIQHFLNAFFSSRAVIMLWMVYLVHLLSPYHLYF